MSPVPLQGVSDRDVLTHGVETPGSITPLLRSEELSLMRMPSAALRAAEGEKGEKEAFLSPRPEGRGYSSPQTGSNGFAIHEPLSPAFFIRALTG
jgi:hypothetical protein